MNARQLAEELLKNPDFEVVFSFDEPRRISTDIRVFDNVWIENIEYSKKRICLNGEDHDW